MFYWKPDAGRRPVSLPLALAASVLFVAGVLPATAEPALDLTLAGTDGLALTVVEIDLRSEEASGAVQFFLRQESGTAELSVSLSAVFSQGTLTLSPDPVVVPPAPGQQAVTATVSSLTRGGVFDSALVASTDSGAVTIGRVVIRKTSILSIQGTGADGVIKLTHPVAEFMRAFKVVSNAATATAVTLEVDDFLSEASVATATTVTVDGRPYGGEALTVPAGGAFSFVVSAVLPGAEKHTSGIALRRGAERILDTPLTVTRTNAPPTVQIDPLAQLEVTRSPIGGDAAATLRIALRETGGREHIFAFPELINLVRKDGARLPSTEGRLEIDTGDEVRLDPYEPKLLETRLVGLTEAGELSGKVRFRDGTGGVLDQTLTIFVRDHWVRAFFCILIGVLVSSGIHWLLTVRRKKLTDRYECVLIEDEIRSCADWLPATPPRGARELIADLLTQVKAVYDLTSSPVGGDTATRLTEVREKTRLLRSWIHAAVRADALGVRGKHDAAFESVSRVLKKRGSTAPQRTEAETKLTTLASALDTESALPLDELEQRIDAMLESAPGGPDVQALEDMAAKLADARTAIANAESEEAERLVEEVRELIGASQLMRLRTLTAGTVPAPGLSADEWKALKTRLNPKITAAEALEGEAKVDEADRVMKSLLGELIPGLRKRMVSKANGIEPKDLDLAEDIRAAARRLDTATPRLAEGAVGAAAKIYQQVQRKYVEHLGPRLVANGVQMRGRGEQDPLAVPIPLEDIRLKRAPETKPLPSSKLPSRLQLGAKLRFENGIAWLTLAVIAVVLGMNVVYVKDPDWGGWADYLIALLWGLGVHSVGSVRSAGVQGLREQFATVPDS